MTDWNDHYLWRGPDFADALFCPCDLSEDHGPEELRTELRDAVNQIVTATEALAHRLDGEK